MIEKSTRISHRNQEMGATWRSMTSQLARRCGGVRGVTPLTSNLVSEQLTRVACFSGGSGGSPPGKTSSTPRRGLPGGGGVTPPLSPFHRRCMCEKFTRCVCIWKKVAKSVAFSNDSEYTETSSGSVRHWEWLPRFVCLKFFTLVCGNFCVQTNSHTSSSLTRE
jgi:hypothetical protein